MARESKHSGGEGWGVVWRCPVCGREEGRCSCPPKAITSLPFGKQRPRFRLEKRRGKPVTIITHLTLSEADLKALGSQLKNRLGTGGTSKGSEIELQGDHREALVPILSQLGFRT
jgi:translation initiation factor 1